MKSLYEREATAACKRASDAVQTPCVTTRTIRGPRGGIAKRRGDLQVRTRARARRTKHLLAGATPHVARCETSLVAVVLGGAAAAASVGGAKLSRFEAGSLHFVPEHLFTLAINLKSS